MHQVFKFNPDAKLPHRNHKEDAGADIYADQDLFIPVGETGVVQTGIGIHVDNCYVAKIENRSGMSLKGLDVSAGIVDAGYNGEIKVVLHNVSCRLEQNHLMQWGINIRRGDRIAQVVMYPIDTTDYIETKYIWDSPRGNKGFGSSDS